jgi:hypothetical protein
VIHEEAALVVQQELVKLSGNRLAHAKPLTDACEDRLQACRPMLAPDPHPICPDLPGPPDLGVDHGVRAPPVRRALCNRNKLLGLDGKERQSYDPDAFDLQPGRGVFHCAGHEKIARPIHCAQQ